MVLFVMPKSKKRGGSTFPNSSEDRRGPAVTPGTTTTRRRAGAGERADMANPIPGVPVASLTLEQLMEAVGAVQGDVPPLPAATDPIGDPIPVISDAVVASNSTIRCRSVTLRSAQ